MDKIKIIGGKKLNGKIYISGAKNAALPLICASLLTDETVTLTNMPMLSDITAMNALLAELGTQIDAFDDFVDGHPTKTYSYRTPKFKSLVAPYDFVRKMRWGCGRSTCLFDGCFWRSGDKLSMAEIPSMSYMVTWSPTY